MVRVGVSEDVDTAEYVGKDRDLHPHFLSILKDWLYERVFV